MRFFAFFIFLIFSVLQQNGIKNGIICSYFSFTYK
ncbi:TPA: hypothetical protein PE547_002498 [Staphylococcus aureus]|nr:hypothetical protein [Staphylococcus aureus]MBO8586784.1 hypothetical protein [Staphylococcus aureus]MCC0982211.1 hypothetical protein [Staphylococcus aureus]HCA7173989.1 hypothetical protein [Staphylococcus aureus]HCY0469312.1 hypothetical protein [Staphylococcus aureus]HCY7041738.1 hypothetical protein [Staphylococcus aureus]